MNDNIFTRVLDIIKFVIFFPAVVALLCTLVYINGGLGEVAETLEEANQTRLDPFIPDNIDPERFRPRPRVPRVEVEVPNVPEVDLEPELDLSADNDSDNFTSALTRAVSLDIHSLTTTGGEIILEMEIGSEALTQRNIANALEVMQTAPLDYEEFIIEGVITSIDDLGRETYEDVLYAVYRREVIEEINHDNFLDENVFSPQVTVISELVLPESWD